MVSFIQRHTLFSATEAYKLLQQSYLSHEQHFWSALMLQADQFFRTWFLSFLLSCLSHRASFWDPLFLRGGQACRVPQLDPEPGRCRCWTFHRIPQLRVLGLCRLQIHRHIVSRLARHVWGSISCLSFWCWWYLCRWLTVVQMMLMLSLDWREDGPVGGFLWSCGQTQGLSDGQMAIPEPQLICSYTVIIVELFSLAVHLHLITCYWQKVSSQLNLKWKSKLEAAEYSSLALFFLLILTFSIKMSRFFPYSLNISCCSCPLAAADIKVSSSLKAPPPKRSIFISVIQFYWASTSNYYPLTFMPLKGADKGL